MSAYATPDRRSSRPLQVVDGGEDVRPRIDARKRPEALALGSQAKMLDGLITVIAERVAEAITAQLATSAPNVVPEWLDSRGAAEYLGLHRDTLRKLAAERAIPAEQDGPGCKLFFLRADLDEWRRAGGKAAHLVSTVAA
jgi:excisionase family DNA binding protein